MNAFYALAVLACPLAMGAMMWFMMKGGRQHSAPTPYRKTNGYAGFETDPGQADVAALREELVALRARLDDQSPPSLDKRAPR